VIFGADAPSSIGVMPERTTPSRAGAPPEHARSTTNSPSRSTQVPRTVLLAVIGVLVTLTVVGWLLVIVTQSGWLSRSFAIDYAIYMDGLDRWRLAGEWYRARQLLGPYPIELGDILYPPVLMYLLFPFRYLGPVLWTAIPAAIVVSAVIRQRPALWAVALIAACLAWPYTPAKFVFGNPVIWGAAALAVATFRNWPAAFLLIKPTVIPFALFGIRDRRWWLLVAVLAVASLPVLYDTLRYPEVLLNAQTNPIDGRGGPFYSITEYPLLCIPLLAWLGRRRPKPVDDRAQSPGPSQASSGGPVAASHVEHSADA
jgi:hypothetical protein